jgi:hypothetical protein
MKLGQTHKQEFNMKLTCTTKQKRQLMQVGHKYGEANLVGTTSSSSYTKPITFERRHHFLLYSIQCDFP